jgi:hypothetical protein
MGLLIMIGLIMGVPLSFLVLLWLFGGDDRDPHDDYDY